MQSDPEKLFIEKALYPAMEAVKGNRVRTYYQELRQSQTWSAEALRRLQAEKLKKLLRACLLSVPAYRDCGLSEEQIEKDPFSALSRVPLLRRRAFRENAGRYCSEDPNAGARILNRTGGSTGEPVTFYMSRYAVEHYEAARFRGLSWHGLSFGSRCAMLWGNPIELDEQARRTAALRDRFLKNRVILSAYELSEQTAADGVRFLNRYQPEYLYGYANALAQFARLLAEQPDSLRLNRLKAVVSTSETLYPEQRALLEKTFGCRVANEYGARDAGILAYECPCGGLHLTAENAVVEIVDPVTGAPVPTGESGLVVVTDLHNFVMPRLRYVLGDVAALSAEACPCGLGLPLLKSIEGREDALFTLPDGTLVHGNFVNQLTRKYPGLAQFQLVQKTKERAVLYVVCGDDAQSGLSAFRREVEAHLPGVAVTLDRVASIAPAPSGKTRYAVREFPL